MDNKQKIINQLGRNYDKTYTMHQLSKVLRIPYASFYRTIQDMKDLLIIETIGKSKILKLNWSNQIIKSYLAISSDEKKKEFLKNHPIIKKIVSELETKDIVLLFGSYAKGRATNKSDIDLLIVNKDGKKSLSFSKYETLFNKEINPIFVTRKEFRLMLKDEEENVGKQALKEHIVLDNPDKFWEVVIRAVR